MNTVRFFKRVIGATLVAGALAWSSPAWAAFNATLQGQDFGSTNWVGGPLNNWAELQDVPCRVHMVNGPASGKVITVNFDHTKGGTPAIQNLVDFSTTTNVVITVGPTLSAPSGSAIWTYTFTINLTDSSPGDVLFFSRLSAGSHDVTGGSMSLGGTPSLGNLGIKTPIAQNGNPDLSTVKTGPTNANPGQVITYGVSYNLPKSGDGATGVQLVDTLPNSATLTFISATGGPTILGDTITWDLGNLKAGSKGRFLITAQVASNAVNNSTLQNLAAIASAQIDPNTANNSSSVVTRVVNGCIIPVVNAPPLSSSNTVGSAVTFDVVANGTNPLRYQWRKGTVGIANATNATYSIPSVAFSDADTYDVIVSNACGSVTSAGAVLTVVTPPDCSITGPSNVCVSATGLVYTNASTAASPSFSWMISGNGTIVGSTSNASVTVNAGASGSFTIQSTVVDGLDASNTCSQIVSVTDTTPPLITQCATNILGTANASCQAAAPSFTNAVIASDNCSAVTISQSPVIGALLGLGTNTINLIAADQNGNSSTCTASFIVLDLTPPTITALPPNQQGSADGNGQAVVPSFIGGVTATDNCSVSPTITQSPVAGTLAGLGTNIVTLTVADSTGNSTNATVLFIVIDTTPPTISQCATNQSAEAGSGCQAAVPDFTTGVIASDNSSGAVTIAQSPLAGAFVGVGANPVTLTATDGSGNSTNCAATFTVTDTTLPTITLCAANVTVDTDAGTNFASNVNLGAAPVASDLCGIGSTSSNAPSTFPTGTNLVIWTVTDTHGNPATCTQQVVVVDNEPPQLTCPANISTNLDVGVCSLTNVDLGTPVTSDNVGVASVVNDAPASYGIGTNEVVWTVTDSQGNTAVCTQLVIVVDVTAPTINSLPADQQASVGAGCQAPVPDFAAGVSASDDCSGTNSLMITQSPTAGTLVGSGTNAITIIVTDASGNTTTGTVDFTVADTIPPTITQCPASQGASSGTNGTVAVPDFTSSLTATGNCSGSLTVTQSPTAGTLVGMGSHTITLTVTDDAGNSNTCTATFSVDDTTPPQITQCAGNQSAAASTNCQAAVPNFTGGVVATDDSGSATITQIPPAGTLVGLGTNTVTLTATDGSGNFTNCSALFIVADTTVPLIACPGDVVVTAPVGSNSVTGVSLGSPTASDNCGTVTVTNDAPASFPIGNTIVTWTANDGNGNTSTCQQTVTVASGNAAPIANNDSYTVAEDDSLDVAAPGVLANDTDASPLTAILVSTTTNGVLSLNANGSFTYVPNDNFNGTDSFVYKANDGTLDSSNATVTITVTPVNGAGDIDLYAKSESFKVNWGSPGHGQFKIKGKINPRGATNDLTGATMQISINGTNIFAPVTLDTTGVGNTTVGSTKITAKLKSATGSYSYTISGVDLSNAIGLPNTTGSGVTPLAVVLTIRFADLEVTPISGVLETSYTTKTGKFSKGKFVFKTNRTITGAFNWNKTTATQAKDGSFKVNGKGVAENEGGTGIAPTGNIRVTMGGSVFTIPAAGVKFSLNGTSRTFKINASGLTATGIPLASGNAPTVHELPIMFEVPLTGGTNIFETIIELKRPTGTSTKWKR